MTSSTRAHPIPPWAGAACALAAMALILAGIAVSWPGYAGYTPWLRYISELAHPSNPLRWAFRAGLATAGLLFVPFGVALADALPHRHGRVASRLVVLAGPTLSLTGLFPLTQPVPHFTFAATMFASVIFAELYVARAIAAIGTKGNGWLELARRSAMGLFWFHVIAAVAGFVYSGVATRHVHFTSASQMLLDAPPYQQLTLGANGPTVNPVAIMEWVFLATALVLPLGASLRLVGAGRPEREAIR